MRLLLIVLALFLFAGSPAALEQDAGKEPLKKPATSATQKKATRKDVEEKKTPEWPRPYKSTEEVSVDSIVPLPTDI